MATFLTNEIFQTVILPFIFVFALFFAILEKSKLLGDERRQINAILSFVIAALLIGFSTYVDWITKFILFLVIAIVVLFVFMLIYGFIYGNKDGDPLKAEKWIKMTLGPVALIAVIAAVLFITGWWDKIKDSGELGMNLLIIIVIVGALIAVFSGGDKKESK